MSVAMKEAVTLIKHVLEDNGYKYKYNDEKYSFDLSFSLSKTKLSSIDIRILVRPTSSDPNACHRIMSYGTIDMHADADCMVQVCEFLARANYGLSLGNFELDHSDGEIRYKVSMNCKDSLPGYDAIDDLLGLPVAMFNRYGNGLLTVIMGVAAAKEAIDKIEG